MTNKMLAVQNAIKSAVEGITTDGSAYNFDLNGVMGFGSPDVDDVVGGRPEVFLTELSEEGTIRPTSTVRKRLTFTLVGITGSDMRFADVGTETLKLGADIEKAITNDVTLGTVVDYTELEAANVTYFAEGARGVVTLQFFAEYPITLGAP